MKVSFCRACRRLILADFSYCPYCGAALQKAEDLAELLDAPFERIEQRSEARVVGERFDELASRLTDIELELETMLAARGETGSR